MIPSLVRLCIRIIVHICAYQVCACFYPASLHPQSWQPFYLTDALAFFNPVFLQSFYHACPLPSSPEGSTVVLSPASASASAGMHKSQLPSQTLRQAPGQHETPCHLCSSHFTPAPTFTRQHPHPHQLLFTQCPHHLWSCLPSHHLSERVPGWSSHWALTAVCDCSLPAGACMTHLD